ncbi:quinone-dependent dihydroorotate dehydrogenase [Sphingomonas paeninsulae]|jgi:dihydroorotate dehydrogenase|uniref:Dihydroorotate dehydrogenase (quinone) n=1 Tax=Sphingomonas paeninsulae TaxID=2319844 RepID=A0A494TG81_SPHPE|nr:quinone-dependent dihydroorotate dehydrogenase [Sphingomonas paeninsulae]AYJ86302.1 quinone-dependent dihydroorotate dehydrogenase [Sphingomonas paeninsulae]
MIFSALRPLLFQLDPERAHRLTIAGLRLLPASPPSFDPRLTIEVAGLRFPSPVGLAAGFDKDAEVPDAMLRLGFGSVEIGTITPLPQIGNPKPRLFRLAQDEAVINRMGFNNSGQPVAHIRLAARHRTGIVGVNIGANKDATDRIADYAKGVHNMADVADYLTINISSPNTPGLRALQDAGALRELLAAIQAARSPNGPPVFLKVAPDLEPADIDDITRAAIDHGINALIVANTTISRPPLHSKDAGESGGLSGAPLKTLALERLRDFRRATGGQLPLIAAGGIASADDAYARIRAGASLIQLYSALVYHGPGLARRITAGLLSRLDSDGFATLTDAVG